MLTDEELRLMLHQAAQPYEYSKGELGRSIAGLRHEVSRLKAELSKALADLHVAAVEGVHIGRRFDAIATIAYDLAPDEVGAIDKIGEIHRLAKGETCVLGQDAECGDYHNAGQCVRPQVERPHAFVAMPASSIGSCAICSRPEGYRTHRDGQALEHQAAQDEGMSGANHCPCRGREIEDHLKVACCARKPRHPNTLENQ
jgi:uncharacterized small protein (DUF1192 family)